MIVSVIGGTGPQGLGIAERLAIAGVDVIVGSRKEEKALDVVAKAKEDLADYDLSNMRGMANEDAAKEGDTGIHQHSGNRFQGKGKGRGQDMLFAHCS